MSFYIIPALSKGGYLCAIKFSTNVSTFVRIQGLYDVRYEGHFGSPATKA